MNTYSGSGCDERGRKDIIEILLVLHGCVYEAGRRKGPLEPRTPPVLFSIEAGEKTDTSSEIDKLTDLLRTKIKS